MCVSCRKALAVIGFMNSFFPTFILGVEDGSSPSFLMIICRFWFYSENRYHADRLSDGVSCSSIHNSYQDSVFESMVDCSCLLPFLYGVKRGRLRLGKGKVYSSI